MSCNKRRYKDRVSALLALESTRHKKRARGERRAYPCPKCKGWHLTSIK